MSGSETENADFVPEVNEAFVRDKCDFLVETHLWPLQQRMDPNGWLQNFRPEETRFAVQLLNSFMYYSSSMVDQLFISAFLGLSREVLKSSTRTQRIAEWKRFLQNVIITFPTGESPSAADSGYSFARRARDLLDIPESQIQEPLQALDAVERGRAESVVFVDDFVGSGNQFHNTWTRPYAPSARSFATRSNRNCQIYYIPLFCTEFALANSVKPYSDDVNFLPVHTLTDKHSVLSDSSMFWPTSMREAGKRFVKKMSSEIGLLDTNCNTPDDWRGFACLGLGIAFEHQIPDASLPLFYTTKNGWNPLWKKKP